MVVDTGSIRGRELGYLLFRYEGKRYTESSNGPTWGLRGEMWRKDSETEDSTGDKVVEGCRSEEEEDSEMREKTS